MPTNQTETISLRQLFHRFTFRILFTWLLVLFEAALFLLFPLFMGIAIDDYLAGSYRGVWLLGLLGVLSLLVGAGRRFYDTRIYANIYAQIAPELVDAEKRRDSSVSIISARVNLATEFVEFFENTFPEIITNLIGLGGTLFIILFLNVQVFIACLISTVLIGVVYAATSNKTYRLNSGYNEELEKQVEVITKGIGSQLVDHFKKVMKWNIRLSDLETSNFSISWVFLFGVLLFAIVTVIDSGLTAHGKILSILMYVFNYIESVIMIPLFYQQFVRLREITHRFEGKGVNRRNFH